LVIVAATMVFIFRGTRIPAVLALTLAACGNSARPSRDPAEGATVAQTASSPPPTPTASATPAAVTASAPLDAGAPAATAAAEPDAVDAGPAPIVADNKVAPTEGPELQERARGLFEAIVQDNPDLADPFWFPREPFIPLKDIQDPGKYWTQLHRTYGTDVHILHKERKSWAGAHFVGFDGWSRSKWVPPGDEANKIGYHRAFHGRLRYTVGAEEASIDVHTIITWQGRWYVTHLRKFKK
jgi:hypothetical protein